MVTEKEKMRSKRKRSVFGGALHLLMRCFAKNTDIVAADAEREGEREVELKAVSVSQVGKREMKKQMRERESEGYGPIFSGSPQSVS